MNEAKKFVMKKISKKKKVTIDERGKQLVEVETTTAQQQNGGPVIVKRTLDVHSSPGSQAAPVKSITNGTSHNGVHKQDQEVFFCFVFLTP